MSKDFTPLEVAKAVAETIQKKLDEVQAGLARLQKAEAVGKSLFGMPPATPSDKQAKDGNAAQTKPMKRTVFQVLGKGEEFLDRKHLGDPVKRYKEIGYEGKAPSDRKEKEISAEGSGGDVVKKAGENMAAKPPKGVKPPSPTVAPAKGSAGADKLQKTPATVPSGKPSPGGLEGGGEPMQMNEPKGVFAKLAKKKVK